MRGPLNSNHAPDAPPSVAASQRRMRHARAESPASTSALATKTEANGQAPGESGSELT